MSAAAACSSSPPAACLVAWRCVASSHGVRGRGCFRGVRGFWQVVRLFSTHFRLLITGTPLQNDLHELWAMLNFLLPEIFTDAATFDSWFNLTTQEGTEDVLTQLHKILRPFLLRRCSPRALKYARRR